MAKRLHLQFLREAKFLHKVNHQDKINLQPNNNLELLIWEVSANNLNSLMKISHKKKCQIN
jgi:hypothetical protein